MNHRATVIAQQQAYRPPAQLQGALKWFTADQIASALSAPIENVERYWPALAAALDELAIGDRPTTIAALATIGVEVGAFAPINEYGGNLYFEGKYGPGTDVGQQLGNVEIGDGARYHGRGFIQLTGRANYRRYGERLGVNLEGDPELALDAAVASRILATYFLDHGIPAMAAAGLWVAVRRAVNGGTNGLNRFIELVAALEQLPTP